MTLPTNQDTRLYTERPGDEIFAQVKHHFPDIARRSAELQKKLVSIILDDLVIDHALSNALDEIGRVITYQAQNEEVEPPKFFGLSILKDAERVGKLNFVLSLCGVLELDVETMEAVRAAEIERLWGVETKEKREGTSNVLRLSDEVAGILKDITRSLNKKERVEVNVPAGKHNAAADRLARTLRERTNTHSSASKRER